MLATEEVVEIQLGKSGRVAIVDAEDEALVTQYRWRLQRYKGTDRCYAAAGLKDKRTLYMHRLVIGAGPGTTVDHIDGDGLNNRRCNLHIVPPPINAHRRHTELRPGRLKGAYPHKGKWTAKIRHGHLRHLGMFPDQESAARAYDAAARELYGEWAMTNFPMTHQFPN